MIKINKIGKGFIVVLLGLSMISGTFVGAATPAKQLATGIALYNDNKDEKAMDYFIDVLVNGNSEEVAEANKYIDLIHNRIGGIQAPVEVDVNFKEGEVKTLEDLTDDSVRQAQAAAQAAAEEEAARLQAAKEEAAAQLAAQQQDLVDQIEAQQQALADKIEAQRLAAQEAADNQRQALLQQAEKLNEASLEKEDVDALLLEDDLWGTADGDWQAIDNQTEEQISAASSTTGSTTQTPVVSSSSSFVDLTSDKAIEARELYTTQKIASMTDAAINKIKEAKGVQLYMRDDRPDALDIDPEVIFDRGSFRKDSLPLLNSIYELLALTQGSAYVILPPGSYTDDVTLSGIRQAMALNSYLINRGISQGKLHYNMGLADEEPPARFANLNGLSIVFDYDAQLPTVLEKNENNEKAPLLSMAVVPLCHAIDRYLGEAFVIDFSVLETMQPIDNWTLQVVQHGQDGKYYIVRQLEGFAPVYHQILWNGRKGIIGPELPCGKYTLVLTGTDLKGNKQTIRRRIIVKCDTEKKTCATNTCSAAAVTEKTVVLDYKTPRLWKKPGRTMHAQKAVTSNVTETSNVAAASSASSSQVTTRTVNTTTIIEEEEVDPLATGTTTTNVSSTTYTTGADELPMSNPYDMPYEDYNN